MGLKIPANQSLAFEDRLTTGHDNPRIFPLTPDDIVLEVPLEHPEHLAFSDLNLRWYALPAISNIGIDVGGLVRQSHFLFVCCARVPGYFSCQLTYIFICLQNTIYMSLSVLSNMPIQWMVCSDRDWERYLG